MEQSIPSAPSRVKPGVMLRFVRFVPAPARALFVIECRGDALLELDVLSVPLDRYPRTGSQARRARSRARRTLLEALAA